MGTKLLRTCLEEEEKEIPQVPPGFESCLSFHIKTDDDKNDKRMIRYSAMTSALGSQLNGKEAEGISDSGIILSSCRPKFRIKCSQSDNSSEEAESDHVKSGQMGTEFIQTCVGERDVEIAAIPPGFESCLPFCFKTEDDNNKMISCLATCAVESQSNPLEAEGISDTGVKIRPRRHKFRIKYSQPDKCSKDVKSDPLKSGKNLSSWTPLSKGVIRGCSECSNCQKVKARWRPEDACRPELDAAPVFYPSEEDFKDTLRYIASIRTTAEKYGICRIVPPPSWKPPCLLKEKTSWEGCNFATRVQRIDKLQIRHSRKVPNMFNHSGKKNKRCRTGVGNWTPPGVSIGAQFDTEQFGFEPGPEFTLKSFEIYANDFKTQYFSRNKDDALQESEPSVENIEGEYWRMVEKPTEEIEVLYGADLETGSFGSGFPKMSTHASSSDDKYVNSGWNLNNFPRLPGSVLSYEAGDISGVLVPWLYIGMCFSSFCWHVEDHHLYSLNYMHWGAPKLWYGIPGVDALKLEEAMRKHLPDLFEEQPDLLHKLVTQLSPSIVKSEGVPVYRCIQKAGEFVLTFPRAYHSGFNCGFNCAEAVNVGPIDWLPHGHNAMELYHEQRRKTSISHDKLLLGASRDAVRAHWELNLLKKCTSHNLRWKDVCGNDGILAKALKARVEVERAKRNSVCQFSQVAKMESSFDANSERECCVCYFDLHLSAAGCHCSPDRFVCLSHVKQLCSCAPNLKFYLFRYDIHELNLLVEALEGKLSAIYRWAKLDLGLALHSYVSEDTSQASSQSSHSPPSPARKENPYTDATTSVPPEKDPKVLITFSLGRTEQASFSNHSEEHSDSGKQLVFATCCENSDFRKIDDDFLETKKSESDVGIAGNGARHSQICERREEIEMNGKSMKIAEQGTGSPSCSQVNMDKNFRQRGPRVAKVAQKGNIDVTILEFGTVQPGKLWCNSFAIFPRGFRSRVRYISILDPTTTCNYISEILDAGLDEPLFMVSVEHLRNEAFIHFSAWRCWEMVRDRLNEEITKQHRLGRKKLPPLQPPGSLDGLHMFGFSSPSVMQSIEKLDKDGVCKEYWTRRRAGPEKLQFRKKVHHLEE